MSYDNLHIYRTTVNYSFNQPQNRLWGENAVNGWFQPSRDNAKALARSSALCILFAMYLTDQLKQEGKGTVKIGEEIKTIYVVLHECNGRVM